MLAGARPGEGRRDTDDVSVSRLKLLSKVDFVSGRVLEQHIEAGNLLADADRSSRGGVEAAGSHSSGPGKGDATKRSSERHN